MARGQNFLLFYLTIIIFWILTIQSTGFVVTWALFILQANQQRKRPGINFKEF